MFLVNGMLSRHCGTLCPSEVISLVGILILSQAKKTITFVSGKNTIIYSKLKYVLIDFP